MKSNNIGQKYRLLDSIKFFASILFAKERIQNPAVQKIMVPCPLYMDEALIKSFLPDAPECGFSVYKEDDVLWASYLPYGKEDKEGMVHFPGKSLLLKDQRALFRETLKTETLLENSCCIRLFGNDLKDGVFLDESAVQFQQKCLLQICDQFFPVNFTPQAMKYYADIVFRKVYIQNKTALARLLVFGPDTTIYNWLLFTYPEDRPAGYQHYGMPSKFLKNIKMLNAKPGWSSCFYTDVQVQEFEESIRAFQKFLDENFAEIKAFAIRFPYRKSDKWNIMLYPQYQHILNQSKFKNSWGTLPLNWGDIPQGAVGNAFACLYEMYVRQTKDEYFLKMTAFPNQKLIKK